jgi:hypothetical protein
MFPHAINPSEISVIKYGVVREIVFEEQGIVHLG